MSAHGETVPTAGRDEGGAWLRQNVTAADAVRVTASRGAHLEQVVGALPDETDTDDTTVGEGGSAR